jgi:general secretion pathway protein M
MMDWFNNLEPRERRTLVIGAGALIVLLIYFLAWEPYRESMGLLENQVQAQRATAQWMEQAAQEARRLRAGAAPTGAAPAGQSLLALVDTSSKRAGLAGAVKRLQPEGDQGVRMWLERASFDALIQWLATMDTRYGITVSSLAIEREDAAGLVNARLTLQGSGT